MQSLSSEKKFYSLSEFLKITGIKAAVTVRDAINRGEIPATRFGKLYYIPATYVENILNLPTPTTAA